MVCQAEIIVGPDHDHLHRTTARTALLLILGCPDFIPIDSWAQKLVSNEWYRGKPVTAKEVEKRFEKWGEFKGFAYWFWDWKYTGN